MFDKYAERYQGSHKDSNRGYLVENKRYLAEKIGKPFSKLHMMRHKSAQLLKDIYNKIKRDECRQCKHKYFEQFFHNISCKYFHLLFQSSIFLIAANTASFPLSSHARDFMGESFAAL